MAQKAIKTRDPMKHKSGKPRLGPLNLAQLEELLGKSGRPKDKSKIANRIRIMQVRNPAAEVDASNSVEQ